jgi:threonine/homoserine/homoserine lactone efflux protein
MQKKLFDWSSFCTRPSPKMLLWYLGVLPLITCFTANALLMHAHNVRHFVLAIFATAAPWVLSGIVLRFLARTPAQKKFRTRLLIIPFIAIPVLLMAGHLGSIAAFYGWDTLVRMLTH